MKERAFTAIKKDAKFHTRYTKGVSFLPKMIYKRVRG